ncbi:hypothetical protein vBEcoMWL3_gp127 [Escherichia phage vB_EcoM_WL-3]|nr:hypothetical protein vBEcoMWL3_gp127 [Escherichia phage vB_EcoM_WL-3]
MPPIKAIRIHRFVFIFFDNVTEFIFRECFSD